MNATIASSPVARFSQPVIAQFLGELLHLLPILLSGVDVPLEIDIALDRQSPQSQPWILLGDGRQEIAADLRPRSRRATASASGRAIGRTSRTSRPRWSPALIAALSASTYIGNAPYQSVSHASRSASCSRSPMSGAARTIETETGPWPSRSPNGSASFASQITLSPVRLAHCRFASKKRHSSS